MEANKFQNGELDQSGFLITKKNKYEGLNSLKSNPINKKEETKCPHFKLWICDLLNITSPTDNNCYYNFRNLKISIVDIYGVVAGVCSNSYGTLYSVQDGTGEIGCWLDNRKKVKKEDIKNKSQNLLAKIVKTYGDKVNYDNSVSLSSNDSIDTPSSGGAAVVKLAYWLEAQINEYTKTKDDLFTPGTTVHICGKLSDYRGERCIRIYNIRPVTKINEEIDRRFELIYLYNTFYSLK